MCVCLRVCVHAQLLSHVWLLATLWTTARQAPLYGIFQARMLEWVAIFSSRGSFQPMDQIYVSCVSCIASGYLAAREAHVCLYMYVFPGKGSDLPSSKLLRCFPSQDKFIEKLLVTWKYNIIITSYLQTTSSELDTVLGSYTKSLILQSHPIRRSSSHVLRKGNWGSKRFINLPNTYSWQVTEVGFSSKLLISEYTHPMSLLLSTFVLY